MMAAGNPLIALEAVRSFLEDEVLATHHPIPIPCSVLSIMPLRARWGELRSALARATPLGAHLLAASQVV